MVTLRPQNGYVYLCGDVPSHIVSYIRTKIPFSKRNFDRILNAWGVEEAHWRTIEASVSKHFDQKKYSVPGSLGKSDYINFFDKLFITSDAPIEVVKASYRALCKLYHPDLLGNNDKMVEINVAYDSLLKLPQYSGKPT